MSRRHGLTLVELLVAMAVGAIVVALLANLVAGSRRHATASEARVDAAATLRLGAELLREELRLAGAVPWPPPSDRAPEALAAWLAPAVTIAPVATGHALGVRGLDHRVAGAPVERDLLFEVAADGAGDWQLYRKPAGAARQPLVGNLEGLRVDWVVTAEGATVPPGAAAGVRAAALGLELALGADRLSFVVELPARPLVGVGVAP